MTDRWWLAVPLTVGLVLAACSGDDAGAGAGGDDSGATAAPASTTGPAPDPTAAPANDGGAGTASTMTLDGEVIALDRMLCFFEEQPRAGLGGVFTHTAQGEGTDAAGEPVLLDMTRARAEDGTVGDEILVDIGDFREDDAISLRANGPEGLIEFGDRTASASEVQMTDFQADPRTLSFDVSCG